MKKLITIAILVTLLMMTVSSALVVSAQEPTEEPTVEPTEEPTAEPTEEPTVEPTEEPTAEPTEEPTEEPTAEPTEEPTEEPTSEPTEEPTVEPTEEPTPEPTEEPTEEPTAEPTEEPGVADTGDIGLLAAPGRQWSSYYYLMNMGATEASAVAFYYNQDGSLAGEDSDLMIPAGTSLYVQPSVSGPFFGSAVVESSEELLAVENHFTVDGGVYMSGASNGWHAGSTNLVVPLVARNNSGWNSELYLQNTGSVAANVTISYTRGLFGNSYTLTGLSIPANAMMNFPHSSDTNLGSVFFGSAQVTSDQPLVGAVDYYQSSQNLLYVFDVVPVASVGTETALPLIMKNNNNFYTGQQIVNVSDQTANVQITYTAGDYSEVPIGTQLVKNVQIGPYQSYTPILWYDYGSSYDDLYSWGDVRVVGTAVVESDQPVLAVVFEQNNVAGFAEAYNGFDTSQATTEAAIPIVHKGWSNWYVGIQIQNLSSSQADVTVTYKAGPGSSVATGTEVVVNKSIAGNASVTPILKHSYGPGWDDLYSLGNITFSGAAMITSNQPIAVIVNQQRDTSANGDYVKAYSGFWR